MEKDWRIYNSEKEWEAAEYQKDSYYKIKVPFKIKCEKCGSKSSVFHAYEFAYGQQNILKCDKCENEIELYGIDG